VLEDPWTPSFHLEVLDVCIFKWFIVWTMQKDHGDEVFGCHVLDPGKEMALKTIRPWLLW
jgi:hypothetical protein